MSERASAAPSWNRALVSRFVRRSPARKPRMPMLWTVAKEASKNWSGHKDSRQGAALAYYSVFSLGPLIVIVIAIAGFVFGREAVSGQIASTIKDLLGDTGAKAVQAMLVDASRPREGLLATSLGLGALLFAAIGVVAQLKDALNTVWEVDEAPVASGIIFEATFYRSPGSLRWGSYCWSHFLLRLRLPPLVSMG